MAEIVVTGPAKIETTYRERGRQWTAEQITKTIYERDEPRERASQNPILLLEWLAKTYEDWEIECLMDYLRLNGHEDD